ncbi:MAG: sodium:solute symporter [Longimicrobiales bacterium]
MSLLNWLIVGAYIIYVVVDGIRRAKGTHEIEGYFLANRSLAWWVAGLSVMATQLSAITMVGTTGQGATDGLRFIQFYFGLPIAMLILCVTLVPLLHNARVFTAYEYLERRFDARTRTLTAVLFLLSRGMAVGVIVAAPAVIFSVIFGWNLTLSVALIGLPAVVYTMIGGVQAVAWIDVKQMVLIVLALVTVVGFVIAGLPESVGVGDALRLAGATGRVQTFDFRFDINETYTFWSGLIGGAFLMLSYFGTDQSQVQRYLTAKSADQAKRSLLISAYWKIPLQALVLLLGVFIFVYYLFTAPPLLFNRALADDVESSAEATAYHEIEARYDVAFAERRAAAEAVAAARDGGDGAAVRSSLGAFDARNAELEAVRAEALELAGRVTGKDTRDVNYITPTFVLHELPGILPGIFIAAVLAAAMSSVAAELNSLSTASVIDIYRRYVRRSATDAHYLRVSKLTTAFWGLFACVVATYAVALGSLIEVVNRFGSFFYGSILGVFLLALMPSSRGRGAFYGLIAGMAAVAVVALGPALLAPFGLFGLELPGLRAILAPLPSISFLWHNVIGAGTVVIVGVLLSRTQQREPEAEPVAATVER